MEMYDEGCCPKCNQYGTLVPLPKSSRHVTWDDYDGRVVEVNQYICVTCGSRDLIQRDQHARYAKHEPQAGQASPMDGRLFAATPYEED